MIRTVLRATVAGVLLIAPATADAGVTKFKGGPFDGLRAEYPDDGKHAPYFLPGLASESPPSPELRAKIDLAFDVARTAFTTSPQVVSGDKIGVRNSSESDQRFLGRLLAQCRATDAFQFVPPFGTPSSRPIPVRVSIVCGDRVTHFITLRFAAGVLLDTQISEAVVPKLFTPPPPH